ncbi:MAG: PKD domain-containing protein [Bacteroidota bacterium]
MKNHIQYILLSVVCLCVSASCEETPLPEEMMGEVVFFAKGSTSIEELDIEAGINDYYMSSSHALNNRDVLVYRAEFQRPSCFDCGEVLRIEINNNEALADGESPDVEEALKTGTYEYSNIRDVSDIYIVDFTSENSSGSTVDSSQWDFGDGSVSMNEDPRHEYVNPMDINPEVCLRTVDANGCVSLICNQVILDSASCNVDFDYDWDPNTGFVNFFDQSEGQYPLRHRWDFGDGFGASLGNPAYFFGRTGDYTVCLTVTDATGCKRTLCKNIGTDPSSCNSNFSYEINQISGPTSPQYNRVMIQWTDKNGKVFRSDKNDQRSLSRFEILESEAYDKNERGENTRKLLIEAVATLWAEDGESIELTLEEASIAVSHP